MGSFFEGVGGPGVGGLLDSEMSSLVSIAAALRRSTETVPSCPLGSILKVLSSRESTWQGPSYGGSSGRRTRSYRRKTWEHVFNRESTYADELETCGGLRSLATDEFSESMQQILYVTRYVVYSKNSPCSRKVYPYTSSAVQALISSLNVDRMARRTIGRLSTQCSRPACDMRAAFSCRCKRSTILFAAG